MLDLRGFAGREPVGSPNIMLEDVADGKIDDILNASKYELLNGLQKIQQSIGQNKLFENRDITLGEYFGKIMKQIEDEDRVVGAHLFLINLALRAFDKEWVSDKHYSIRLLIANGPFDLLVKRLLTQYVYSEFINVCEREDIDYYNIPSRLTLDELFILLTTSACQLMMNRRMEATLDCIRKDSDFNDIIRLFELEVPMSISATAQCVVRNKTDKITMSVEFMNLLKKLISPGRVMISVLSCVDVVLNGELEGIRYLGLPELLKAREVKNTMKMSELYDELEDIRLLNEMILIKRGVRSCYMTSFRRDFYREHEESILAGCKDFGLAVKIHEIPSKDLFDMYIYKYKHQSLIIDEIAKVESICVREWMRGKLLGYSDEDAETFYNKNYKKTGENENE